MTALTKTGNLHDIFFIFMFVFAHCCCH